MAILGDVGKFFEGAGNFLITGKGPTWAKVLFPVNYAAGSLTGAALRGFAGLVQAQHAAPAAVPHDQQMQFIVPEGYRPGYGSSYPYDITGYNFEDPYTRGGYSPWDYSIPSPQYLTPPPVVETVSYPTYSAPPSTIPEDSSLLELAPLLFL